MSHRAQNKLDSQTSPNWGWGKTQAGRLKTWKDIWTPSHSHQFSPQPPPLPLRHCLHSLFLQNGASEWLLTNLGHHYTVLMSLCYRYYHSPCGTILVSPFLLLCLCCYSVLLFSHSVMSLCNPMDCSTPDVPCPSPSPGACSNSCPLSQWCHPTIWSSVVHLILLLPSVFPSIRVFFNELLFVSGGQSIGTSPSASVLPMNIQDWFSLGLLVVLALQGTLSRVFFNTTIQKHQFFGTQPSLWSSSNIHTWLLEKP